MRTPLQSFAPLAFLLFACGSTPDDGGGAAADAGPHEASASDDGYGGSDAAHACVTVADCGVNTGASCAKVCQDGSNPCVFACVAGACVERGCPDDDAGASSDGAACAANGATCSANDECCSGNCILRGTPGFCCQPGGCP